MKSVMAVLIAAVAFGAMAVGNASAFHPLFLTESGKELLVIGLSLRALVRFGNILPVVIHCERDLFHGWILNRSPLIHRATLLLHGKCILLFNGMTTPCTEPIHFFRALLELGLISSTNKKVAILSAPSEGGTEAVKITCGTNTVTLSGAVVGEIPEINAKLENQYNKQLSELEAVFAAENETEKQKITEIFLLGTQMTKVELTASGAGSGPASLESTEALNGDGKVEICTKEPQNCP